MGQKPGARTQAKNLGQCQTTCAKRMGHKTRPVTWTKRASWPILLARTQVKTPGQKLGTKTWAMKLDQEPVAFTINMGQQPGTRTQAKNLDQQLVSNEWANNPM